MTKFSTAQCFPKKRFCHITPDIDRFQQEACRFILRFPIRRQGECAKSTKKCALNGQNVEHYETA